MAQSPNPFDVEALERSLNDSATRVSTIWIGFLIFGLYLVVAASAVTHRQLLLADPIRLPALNVDLPLIGFFFLTPILFVVFHTYVLIQVVLLARTAAAYNDALDRAVKVSTDNAAMRQRLANTLFAQIFAGSPREREGWLGNLLRMVASFTLVITPVLVLLVFQFKFLPYHSLLITWTLRLLILLDLIGVLVLWRAARQPGRDLTRRSLFQGWIGWPSAFALTAFSWIVLTFPGEPHADWTRFWRKTNWFEHPQAQQPSYGLSECDILSGMSVLFPYFDRLSLRGVDVVDAEKLAKMKKVTRGMFSAPRELKFTHSFRERDLNCADLSSADLRRVDLKYAELRGTDLTNADLEGADLTHADLKGARATAVMLGDALLDMADLRSAYLVRAKLVGAELDYARLQGAFLGYAQLQGASLYLTQLQGANLSEAQFEGAVLRETHLQGALLKGAYLQFAGVIDAQLQGADLRGADLSAAHFVRVGLQGADLSESTMQYAKLSRTRVWHTKNQACTNASVDGVLLDAILPDSDFGLIPLTAKATLTATTDNIAIFIERATADISDPSMKQAAVKRMKSGLDADLSPNDVTMFEEVWRNCDKISQQLSRADFESGSLGFLRALFCNTKSRVCARDFDCEVPASVNAVASRIIESRISDRGDRSSFAAQLAQGMLGDACAASAELDDQNKARLREMSVAPNHN
jgi:uncharacterized protein YjbI with pentapeptide repeats